MLRGIIAASKLLGSQVRWMVVGSESLDALGEFLRVYDIGVDGTYHLPVGSDLTRWTPRLQIVGSDGVVLREWFGELNATIGNEVTYALSHMTSPAR